LINYQSIIAVGAGGFFGSVSRFYINTIVAKNFESQLPLATLSVNIIGSFFIGILMGYFLQTTPNEYLKLFLITGFLGALTTYSTFAIESFFLLNSLYLYGVLNIALNLVGSIVSAGIGYRLILKFLD
jgi:CrcB protein